MSTRFPTLAPYPTGWFAVARSSDVAPGAVLPLHYFGRELVLFRTEAGAPRLFDAYCPHLGAHLGYGGAVCGETIRCPFHWWRFDASGACVEVPYAKKIPPKAKLRTWPVCEQNGLVLAYHSEHAATSTYEVPAVPEFHSADWTAPRALRWTIRTHNQEICENIVDSAHLKYMHGISALPRLVGTAAADGPIFRFTLACDGLETRVTLYSLGLLQVRNHTDLGHGMWHFHHSMFITPIDGEVVEVTHLLSVKKHPSAEDTRRAEDAWEKVVADGVRQDLPIFENKAYLHRPVLCDEDGPITVFRKWAEQFYESDTEGRDEPVARAAR